MRTFPKECQGQGDKSRQGQSCRPRGEDGGSTGLQRQGRGDWERARPGTAPVGGGGGAAFLEHGLPTWHFSGTSRCRKGRPGLCFCTDDRPGWSPPWNLKGLPTCSLLLYSARHTLLKWQELNIAEVEGSAGRDSLRRCLLLCSPCLLLISSCFYIWSLPPSLSPLLLSPPHI